MNIKIEFNTDNEAFLEGFNSQVREIMQTCTKAIIVFNEDHIAETTRLRDVNGNVVGAIRIEG